MAFASLKSFYDPMCYNLHEMEIEVIQNMATSNTTKNNNTEGSNIDVRSVSSEVVSQQNSMQPTPEHHHRDRHQLSTEIVPPLPEPSYYQPLFQNQVRRPEVLEAYLSDQFPPQHTTSGFTKNEETDIDVVSISPEASSTATQQNSMRRTPENQRQSKHRTLVQVMPPLPGPSTNKQRLQHQVWSPEAQEIYQRNSQFVSQPAVASTSTKKQNATNSSTAVASTSTVDVSQQNSMYPLLEHHQQDRYRMPAQSMPSLSGLPELPVLPGVSMQPPLFQLQVGSPEFVESYLRSNQYVLPHGRPYAINAAERPVQQSYMPSNFTSEMLRYQTRHDAAAALPQLLKYPYPWLVEKKVTPPAASKRHTDIVHKRIAELRSSTARSSVHRVAATLYVPPIERANHTDQSTETEQQQPLDLRVHVRRPETSHARNEPILDPVQIHTRHSPPPRHIPPIPGHRFFVDPVKSLAILESLSRDPRTAHLVSNPQPPKLEKQKKP